MSINLTRRAFFGGATAWAVWPKDLFGAPGKEGKAKLPQQASAWEKPDGNATDSVMARRLYLDLAGRIPTRDEAQAYVYSADPKKRAVLADKLLASSSPPKAATFATLRPISFVQQTTVPRRAGRRPSRRRSSTSRQRS